MSKMATALLKLAFAWANFRGSEPAYLIGNTDITVKFVNPSKTGKYAWEKFYEFGNIFLKGTANPLEIRRIVEDDEIKGEFVASEKWQSAINQHELDQALQTKGAGWEKHLKYAFIAFGVQAVAVVIIVALFLQ